ncbi:TIM barrel protein [Burkholderia sp. AU31624]|uniref:TIM barrel protein n=1 Tax=Burkholderia sp. AU31624 TaxID=2879629 RepID=UPI001CF547AC|nr:TIM barrel protein [Burkholderia sp. AU31624]MCA8254086.1 TIM barrel protein [Burkholderia sp. AU31624]
MTQAFHFSLNRMSAPRLPFDRYVALCQRLGVDTIEIRNDLDGVEIADGAPAATVRATAEAGGVTILTINALQRFEQWNAERADEATVLADYAAQCGARALVLCPTNSRGDTRGADVRHADLVKALKALKPILDARGLLGFIEPLGFEECALRRKSDAVKGIYDAAGEQVFRLVHDTFHHHLSGEDIFFPNLTGLVHLSGVEEDDLPVDRMRDGHRVLVGGADRLGNIRQLRELLARGYRGAFSFEPFAHEIAEADDIEDRLRASIDYVRGELANQ